MKFTPSNKVGGVKKCLVMLKGVGGGDKKFEVV